jgi:hypothetical protein
MKRQIRRRRPDLRTSFAFSATHESNRTSVISSAPFICIGLSIPQEESMNKMGQKNVAMIALGTFALVIGLGELRPAQAQQAKEPYPSMAPLDQYLMERNAEIAMARSAAPETISRDADVLVLGRHGYETAVKGKNGFVCVVERGWMGPFDGEFAVNFLEP